MTTAYTVKQTNQVAKGQPVTVAVRDGKGHFTPVGVFATNQPNAHRFTAEMYLYTESFATLAGVRAWVNKTADDLGIRGMGVTAKITDNGQGTSRVFPVE